MKHEHASAALPFDTRHAVAQLRRGERLATEGGARGAENGERALMRAVLQDAILCLRGHGAAVPRRQRLVVAMQAHRWIASSDLTWPFSFESICDVLGLNPECLRRQLLRESLVGSAAQPSGNRAVWHVGGMVSMLRTVRMTGNQRQRPLRARRRRRRSARRLEGGSHAVAGS